MTDWIDFAIYMAFLLVLWFTYPTARQRLLLPIIADRNADWLAAHPDYARHVAARRWPLRLSYALGGLSLVIIAAYQTGLWSLPEPAAGHPLPSWVMLWWLTMASMLAALLTGGLIAMLDQLRLRRRVPIAPRRQATLMRRSLSDYLPRPVQYAVYALVIANLVAWTAAGIMGAHSSPIFWQRAAIMFILSTFFLLAAHGSVVRRPNVLDRLYGPGFRRSEVRFVFLAQLLPPIVGALRLYEEVNHVQAFDVSRAMQLVLILFMTYMLARLSHLPPPPGEDATSLPAMPAAR